MTEITGQTALITGGASGIGLLMGEILLQKGLERLIVWDISTDNIAKAAKWLGPKAEFRCIDLTDTPSMLAAAEEIDGKVDILINNAGIIVCKPFADHSHAEIDYTMQVNISALMHLTRAMVTGMVQRGQGHIVNISSAAGMVSNPNMSVYCGSKWAVIGWSDSLRLELEATKTGVHVTTVTPYYINTGMFNGVKSPAISILESEPTAQKVVRAIEKNSIFLRVPRLLCGLTLARGLLPVRVFDFFIGRVLGVYSSMTEFKGRTGS